MQAKRVDICVIDADPVQRELLFRHMVDRNYAVVQAADGEAGLRQIREHHPRVVIAELMLPGIGGEELCRRLRRDETLRSTHIVIISASGAPHAKRDALRAGADGFTSKPIDMEELFVRVANGLRISHMHEDLQNAAITDGLTGLLNHSHFRKLLDQEVARARRYGGDAALLMLDIDHFKAVNDTFGHEVGNRVLELTAALLRRMVRHTDTIARYGGEEFAVICPATGPDQGAQLADRIRAAFAEEIRVESCPHLRVTATLGVSAVSDPHVSSARDLINQADQAMYCGKRGGRNRVVRSDRMASATDHVDFEYDDVERLRKQVVSLSMQAKELCLQSVWALVQALEARDPLTAGHSRNTTFYAGRMARAARLREAQRAMINNAAMLHDLGKIGVSDEILQSITPLSPEQAAVLQQVPMMTCRILEPLRIFEAEIVIIRHLRERYDGTGFPGQLRGRAIPLGSRLLAVAETFDALTSDRVHRASHSIDGALHIVRAEAGGQFDPEYVELLARVVQAERGEWEERIARQNAEARRLATQGQLS